MGDVRRAPPEQDAPSPGASTHGSVAGWRLRLALQLAVALVFVALTTWNGLVFHRVVAAEPGIPLWTGLTDALQRAGDRWLGQGNYLANPVTYVVLPLAVLALLGARPATLGFGRAHRLGRVLALWLALPAVVLGYALAFGGLGLPRLALRLLSNTMQNGFWEEFLFRGVIQTRLRSLVGSGWALVAQALLFGAWHVGLGFTNTGHAGPLPALASTIVYQAVIGLALGVIFARSRNLAAPSIVHVVINSLG